jgi:hypothetical protein
MKCFGFQIGKALIKIETYFAGLDDFWLPEVNHFKKRCMVNASTCIEKDAIRLGDFKEPNLFFRYYGHKNGVGIDPEWIV